MPLCSDVENVLELLDEVQNRLIGTGNRIDSSDPRVLSQVNSDLNTLLSVLSNPVFQRICKIQDSVSELGTQLIRHPSCTTNDFDITPEGALVLKISPAAERFRPTFDATPIGKSIPSVANVPPASANSPSSNTPTTIASIAGTPPPKAIDFDDDAPLATITTPTYAQEFERVVQETSLGREIHTIQLYKPEGSSLGFSVVGLKSQEKGELGIFVQEIQPSGIAARDGRLAEGDQILAIDGQPLDSAITHQQAIGILQQARGEVEIVVARAPESLLPAEALVPGDTIGVGQQPPVLGGERPSSPSEDLKVTDMVLNTEWAQVEVIELINDGTGLGFGIIGGRSTGVVVKTILPGGVADRDGRLQSGDHILQIGEVNLLGMGSEQVAAVLRQCGSCVRLVVARPIEPSSPDALSSQAPIVPTKILGDPEELERHLMQSNGYANHLLDGSIGSTEASQARLAEDGGSAGTFDSLPEVELVDVELKKDSHGLGITIAGYVCEKEELSGIFVKSISEGSAADLSGKISINDRIVEVDGQSLQGFTNHQAVEVLRKTGPVVYLKLERYHHGSKYDQLQSAISHSEHKPPTPSSVSALSLPQVPVDSDGEAEEILAATGVGEDEEEDEELAIETRNEDLDLEDLEMLIDTRYDGEILPTVEAAILAKWSKIMGPDADIVVSQLSKAKEGGGLGISLEGTVDVEDGREVRPHHYIRSILPDGPVGKGGKLLSGDELLEVNGRRLLGLNHVEVVGILKDLPMYVRIVCARRPGQPPPSRPIDTAQDRSAFAARNILGGSLQNLFQGTDRLVKAKSDGSLASTGTTAATDTSLSKLKSRSLEPLTGLAMWSSEPHVIELPKGDRGLGFSILDYQDPMNPSETVIVIRSLVPGGVAQQDGRLIPGDRLLAVNDINLENASLDQAVQALKGAPRGIVRIAVAKPLPLPDTTTLSSIQSEQVRLSLLSKPEDVVPPPLPVSPPPELERIDENVLDSIGSRLPLREAVETDFLSNQVTSAPPLIVPVATERLLSSYREGSITSESESAPSQLPLPPLPDVTSGANDLSISESSNGVSTSSNLSTTGPPLPPALERTIKLKKEEEQLGLNVEVVDGGVNGVIVTSVVKGGPLGKDGRIRIGDYIVAINNESLRNLTTTQARTALRRALLYKDLSVTYIPGGDAEVHKETLLIQQSAAAAADAVEELENDDEDIIERRSAARTPADGQEATVDLQPTTVNLGLTSVTPPAPSSLNAVVSSSVVNNNNTTSVAPSTSARDQPSTSKATITPVLTTATARLINSPPSSQLQQHKSTLSATLAPVKHSETSTVYINTGSSSNNNSETPLPQPQVQKRVVTHVTIFPSPPPDVAQVGKTVSSVSSSSVVTSVIKSSADLIVSSETTQPASTTTSLSRTNSSTNSLVTPTEEPSVPPSIITTPTSDTVTRESLTGGVTNPNVIVPPDWTVKEQDKEPSSSEKESSHPSTPVMRTTSSSGDEGALLLAKHWGPERLVEVHKEPGKSLGISIVGGKVDLYNAGPDSGSAISGIFIKNVLPNSPAGKTGQLKTGDRILAVDDVDLRSASHEKAVEVIRAAGNPVRFLVQSLVQWSDGVGVSVSVGNHDDSETSKSEETEISKSQSCSQTVQSQSCSSHTKTETETRTGTETSGTYTTTSSTTGTTSRSRTGTATGTGTETNGDSSTQTGSESQSRIEQRKDEEEEEDGGEEPGEDAAILRAISPDEGTLLKVAPPPVTPARTPSPELIQAGLADEEKQEIQAKMEAAGKAKSGKQESEDSEHSSEEDDELGSEQQLQGKTRTKQGLEIDRASAGNARRSKDDIANETEQEDEFGYTTSKIKKRWAEVARTHGNGKEPAKIIIGDLEKVGQGLGISLAGHRDRMKMATYICGINPAGVAYRTRQLEVGDEILEVNGHVLYGRCHLNASALIKGLPHSHVKIVALRKPDGLSDLSVKPIVQFPVSLESESPEEKYANYRGLRVVTLKKSGGGLGIMIMEGRHAELGQGIFVSDIQEGSVAELAGLFVGDMILAVNGEDMVGSDYDHAASTLKKTEGNVVIVVCNASKGKEDDGSIGGGVGGGPTTAKDKTPASSADVKKKDPSTTTTTASADTKKEAEKPKLPPKPSKIPSPSKLTNIIPPRKPISPTSLSTSTITVTNTGSVATTPSPTSTNVPSVVVKPATPSPKMLPAPTPSVSPATSVTKMALLVKSRLDDPASDPATCEIKSGKETTIEINKDKMGLGLSIVGGSDTLLGSIIIHECYADGAIAKDGRLKPGDQLLSVNNEDFQSITHSKALAALRQTPSKVKMVVFRDEAVAKEDDMYDITEVELVKKSGKGLGLSIVGRKNGAGVFISDVVPGGIAELHGGLMKGDMIISVNGVDLKNASQEEAASVLKTTMGPIHMKIGRLKAAANRRSTSSTPVTAPVTPTSDNRDVEVVVGETEEDLREVSGSRNSSSSNPPSLSGSPPQLKTVVLERKLDGLGFSIVGGFGSPHGNLPIYVKTVFEKGCAITSGLKRGDQIVAVNSVPCEGLRHHEAVALLKNAKGNVTLTILS